jgi:hypothetical protein
MTLSKSTYCKGVQCPKILWLNLHEPDEAADADDATEERFSVGHIVGALAQRYYKNAAVVAFEPGNIGKAIADTQEFLKEKKKAICEASFSSKSGFCAVDILHVPTGNIKDGAELIEVKQSTSVQPKHIPDIAFQLFILEECGIKVNKVYLMHLNNQYVRHGKLEIRKLFKREDCTKEARAMQKEVAANVTAFKAAAEAEKEPDIQPGDQCWDPYECNYCARCMGDDYNADEEADPHDITITQPPVIDIPALKEFLSTLWYPIYHLDFESVFQEAIPLYDGQKPYSGYSTFQYSLYIQSAPGVEPEKHIEYIAPPLPPFSPETIDGLIEPLAMNVNRLVAEEICKNIPENVCVLVYNDTYEKGRIWEMAESFPDLAPHLLKIHDNIRDLCIPFRSKLYYYPDFGRKWSIKAVLPAMFPDNPELHHKNLEGVHNAGEAPETYKALTWMDDEERKTALDEMRKYCGLDTYGMVKILDKLWETVG